MNETGKTKLSVPILDLNLQHESLQPELNERITDIVNRNAYILGEELEKFEDHFSEFTGASRCVGLSSGTDALRLALRACDVGEGDLVITVPFTFVATAEAILDVGARPVFVDIDRETYCIDADQVEDAISENTVAILPVHLYGLPANMTELKDIADRYDLHLIEDACQAHGASWNGAHVGAIGDVGCFSFYPGKNMGALGDAGAITTNDEKIAKKIRMLRNHGQKDEKYTHYSMGFNCRMDNLHAAVLDLKLDYLEDWNSRRRKRAERYTQQFEEEQDIITPTVPGQATHVYHQYAIQVPDRDGLKEFLEERNIQVGVHYPKPLHLQPAFTELGFTKGDLPVSERVSQHVLTLPCFPEMLDKQQDRVIASVVEYVT